MDLRIKEIESSINHYLKDQESADRQEPEIKQHRTERLQEKITKLKTQMKQLSAIKEQLNDAPAYRHSPFEKKGGLITSSIVNQMVDNQFSGA